MSCQKNYNKLDWVLDHLLAVSDKNIASDLKTLKHQGIKFILVVRKETPIHPKLYKEYGIKMEHFVAEDEPTFSLIHYFDKGYQLLDYHIQKSEPVLVHCTAGKSRSLTIICAYLMKKFNLTTDQVVQYVTLKRPCQQINKGFLKQLKIYEKLTFNN